MQLKSLSLLEEASVSVTVTKSGGTSVPLVLQHPDKNTAEHRQHVGRASPACDSLTLLERSFHSQFLPARDAVHYLLPSGEVSRRSTLNAAKPAPALP